MENFVSDCSISRDFKGIWISKEVWTDHSLTYFEKFLLSEIHSLNGADGCFASNDYFCKFFNERERKIQEGISKLKNLGYIYQESFDGRTRILRTCMNPKSDKSLFSTSEVREPEGVKSLFSTSDLSNSAPLSYIENKAYNKEQQQGQEPASPSVVVFSAQEKEKNSMGSRESVIDRRTKISGQAKEKAGGKSRSTWHESLDTVDIPDADKREITARYSADTVKSAIAWATAPHNPPRVSLAASIKFACQRGIKEVEQLPKASVFDIIKDKFENYGIYNGATCFLSASGIAFERGMKHAELKIDQFFSWAKFKVLCDEFGIDFG